MAHWQWIKQEQLATPYPRWIGFVTSIEHTQSFFMLAWCHAHAGTVLISFIILESIRDSWELSLEVDSSLGRSVDSWLLSSLEEENYFSKDSHNSSKTKWVAMHSNTTLSFVCTLFITIGSLINDYFLKAFRVTHIIHPITLVGRDFWIYSIQVTHFFDSWVQVLIWCLKVL